MSDLVIIEAAINGATSKTVNPNVPVTEDEIVADALACFETGAAIVHQHITGFNLSGEEAAQVYLGIWRRVLAERPDALWYPTIKLGPQAQWYDHIPPLAESPWPGRRIPISPKEFAANWFLIQAMRALSFKIRREAKRRSVTYSFLFTKASGDQLRELGSLIDSGAIRPVVDRVFPFESTTEALAYVKKGRANGKVVVKIR